MKNDEFRVIFNFCSF